MLRNPKPQKCEELEMPLKSHPDKIPIGFLCAHFNTSLGRSFCVAFNAWIFVFGVD